MYDITSAIKLRHRLVGAFRSTKANTPVNITVIGGGPTGIEIASDVQNFANMVAGRHGIQNLQLHVQLVEAGHRILPLLSERSSKLAHKRLEELHVRVRTQTKVTKCTEHAVYLDDEKITSDITIWTAGNKANPLFSYYPDVFTLNERGRVQVSEYFNANSPTIFVIGDAADTPYSGMAQTAIHNAIALAANLKRRASAQHLVAYKPKKPKYALPIGGEWALLETEHGVVAGKEGWDARRQADKWVLQNFLVYELANAHWQQGNKLADF